MAFPTGTAVADTASSVSNINDLLGADLAPVETEAPVAEDTSVAEPEAEVEEGTETEVEGDETTEGEPEEGETEEGEETESGEEEFDVADLETDFAESAYAKAAAHYSKQFGREVDPNDQADRAMLKELMERGRKISELQTTEPEEEPEEEGTEKPVEKEKPVVTRSPEERLQDTIKEVRAYAKSNVNPAVAKEIVLPMMQAMANFIWGKDKAAKVFEGRSDADLAELSENLSAAMAMQIIDAIPGITSGIPAVVQREYPYMSKMHEMAEKEAAVDEILGATDKAGAEQYPGFAKLVDSGAINRALASPELKDAVFNKDPFKNRVAKLKVAFRLARNERVDPKMLAEASKRGRTAEKERATRVAAGRTSPGSSSRGGAPGRTDFLQSLVGGGESPSAKLFKNVGRQK
jgi:hypothetical protein